MSAYYDFLKTKINIAPDDGFDFDVGELPPVLKPHEREKVAPTLFDMEEAV
jgi:hypothetical protein